MTTGVAYIEDTIVAPATPPGTGGVAVVRVSGPRAAAIAEGIAGRIPAPRHAALRRFRDAAGATLDFGLALWFPGPQSFTGEDVLELHCHGGPVIVAGLVEAAVHAGARRADPGEFSRRAFLNDKLDLVQAEAIADLVASGTRQAARAALRSLSGDFSAAVETLAESLTLARLHVEAAIDFPDEDVDFLSDDELTRRIERTRQEFDELLAKAESGRLLRDGLQVVIVGRPNAGKSSLLNALSGAEAAIVTEVAGTTRDVLRERIDLGGLVIELVDTAGLREDPDRIEAEGIRRAKEALARADAALWLVDATAADDDRRGPPEPLPDGLPVITAWNKTDLQDATAAPAGAVAISAKTGAGLDELKARLSALAGGQDFGEGSFTARRRHIDALRTARRHFDRGVEALAAQHAGEILAEELRLSHDALGEITGRITSDDLLGRIFAEFCIGK